MKKDYTSVVYGEERAPVTEYPSKLVAYLRDRFDLKTGNHLLEIGCGRGDFLSAFHRTGLKCSGIDIQKSSVELLPNLNIKQCDVCKEPLPFDKETFDIVYHKSLIEHLYDPSHLMNETCRVLKKGGKLIILTPDWQSQMKNFYEDFTHCRPYTTLAMKDLLNMWGFKNVVSEKFYQLPFLWEYPFLSILSKILGVFLSVNSARWLTQKTGIKHFRWSVELMILGYGKNE